MQQANLPQVISKSSLVSSKISLPTDIISSLAKYGEEFTNQIFLRYASPVGIDRAAASHAPTLCDSVDFFGKAATLFWLRFHIADTFAFLGIYDSASVYQVRSTAELILSHEIFGQMTFDEFLCFLQRFKQGRYGKIYQSNRPNPQEFLMCLTPFWNELSHARGRAAEQEEAERISRERAETPPPTEEELKHIQYIKDRLIQRFNTIKK